MAIAANPRFPIRQCRDKWDDIICGRPPSLTMRREASSPRLRNQRRGKKRKRPLPLGSFLETIRRLYLSGKHRHHGQGLSTTTVMKCVSVPLLETFFGAHEPATTSTPDNEHLITRNPAIPDPPYLPEADQQYQRNRRKHDVENSGSL